MATTTTSPIGPAAASEPRQIHVARTRGDRIFRRLAQSAGAMGFLIMGLIGLFLLIRALPALKEVGFSFLYTFEWLDTPENPVFGVAALMAGTLAIGIIALVIAVPLSIATALFLTEYAPRQLRRPLGSVVDLLAAVPSLIYGIWGFFFLQDRLLGLSRWLSTYLGFIPIFNVSQSKTLPSTFTSSPFIAGVVVSIMVMPICTSVMREVFAQTPPGEKEGALALGATRWGMIQAVVLPFGRGGIVGGAMLGLGRALGETIAIAIIIAAAFDVTPQVLERGGNTIAAHIAQKFGEATQVGLSALMAAGLALFVVTLVVNMVAAAVVSRSRSGKGVEI